VQKEFPNERYVITDRLSNCGF